MVGRKEIHDKLWDARNEEINHLWQRSIFLAAFLTVLITVYFTFAGSVLSDGKEITGSISGAETYHVDISYESPEEIDDEDGKSLYDSLKEFISNRELLILEALSIVGFSFSVLWICMARGSKLSYERIEEGINKAYEGSFFDEELSNAIKKDFIENLFAFGDYTHTPMHGSLPDPDYSFRYFAVEGSKHSLSKVNILIGYVFMALWIMTTVANPFIVDGGMLVPSYLISGILMVIVFKILFRFSVSDGYKDRKVLKLLRRAEQYFGLEPDAFQYGYIAWVLRGPVDSSSDVLSTRVHVENVFRTYLGRCGDKLTRGRIEELLFYIADSSDSRRSHSNLFTTIKAFENDSFLKNMLEMAIMYRTAFPSGYVGVWCDYDGKIILRISEDKVSFNMNREIDRIRLKIVSSNLELSSNSAHLFADNMWGRIRSLNPYSSQDERISSFNRNFENPSTIHLISEEHDGTKLYIRLSLQDSLASDIVSRAIERMNVEVCRISDGKLLSYSYIVH